MSVSCDYGFPSSDCSITTVATHKSRKKFHITCATAEAFSSFKEWIINLFISESVREQAKQSHLKSRTDNMDLFKGQELLKADGSKVSADSALKGKDYVCLYFSAHWCPPCRMFTPKLKEWYAEAKEKGVEIVFVSADKDAQAMKDYMKGKLKYFTSSES